MTMRLLVQAAQPELEQVYLNIQMNYSARALPILGHHV